MSACSPTADFPALRKFFGDSIKGTAEFSYISIGLGMALGFVVGAISIPLPGIGTISLGLSGVLIVALILGNQRRTAGLNWTIPASANLVLRNLGLTVFLAQVGMASGPKFAAAVAETGFLLLGLGAVVLFAMVVPILVLGLYVFRMPFDEVAGIVVGRHRQSGDPGLREQGGADRQAGPRLRHDLSRHHHREDPLRQRCPGLLVTKVGGAPTPPMLAYFFSAGCSTRISVHCWERSLPKCTIMGVSDLVRLAKPAS